MGSCGGCTKCCQAIHIPRVYARKIWDDWALAHVVDADIIRAIWTPISKRRAKKINPYMFSRSLDQGGKKFLQKAAFFKCKKVDVGVGCTIHDKRPETCKSYSGGFEYTDNCLQLIATDKTFDELKQLD